MNLVGKITIVLIFVMSLVFMSFTMAVYATHRPWLVVVSNEQVTAEKPLGLKSQLKDVLAVNKELKEQKEKLLQQLEAEKVAKAQAIAKLAAELETAKAELVNLDKIKAKLDESEREAVAGMNETQATTAGVRTERSELQTQIVQAKKDRDTHFKEVVRLTDELNQAVNDQELLRKRSEDLGKDKAKADEVLQRLGN